MDEQIPTGLPEEPDPTDPSPNEDVLNPGGFRDPYPTKDNDPQDIFNPGFDNPLPEPSF